jgi:hypothetical protein
LAKCASVGKCIVGLAVEIGRYRQSTIILECQSGKLVLKVAVPQSVLPDIISRIPRSTYLLLYRSGALCKTGSTSCSSRHTALLFTRAAGYPVVSFSSFFFFFFFFFWFFGCLVVCFFI